MSGEPHNAGAGQGPVLVDVDDENGALILFAPSELAGAEIEISEVRPDGSSGPRTHVAVLPRLVGEHTVHAAVYPSLASGRWRLWSPDGAREVLTVDVRGGRVGEVWWPESAG